MHRGNVLARMRRINKLLDSKINAFRQPAIEASLLTIAALYSAWVVTQTSAHLFCSNDGDPHCFTPSDSAPCRIEKAVRVRDPRYNNSHCLPVAYQFDSAPSVSPSLQLIWRSQ